MNDKSAVAMVTERMDIAIDGNDDQYSRAVDNEALYMNYIDETTHPYISNIALPWPYIIVESYLGKCIQMLAAMLPYVRIVEEDDDSRPKAKKVEKDVNMVFYRQKWPIFAYNIFKQAFKYGTVFVFEKPWGSVEGVEMPIFQMWNFFKTYWNPYMLDFDDDDAYVIYEQYVPMETLKGLRGNPNYKNLDKIQIFDGDIEDSNEKQIAAFKEKTQKRVDRYSKLVKMYLYFSKRDFIFVTNENNVIRNTRNNIGRIPVRKITPIPQENEFPGMSILEQGKGLFAEASENRNQYNDAVNLMMNPQWIIGRDAGVKKSNIVAKAGNILFTDDVSQVTPMPLDWNILTAAMNRSGLIERDIQNYSNAFPQMRGQAEGGGSDTATEYIGMRQAGELRSQTYNLLLSMMSIEAMAKDIIQFKQMFMQEPSSFYYWPDNNTATVTPEDYLGNFTFKSYAGFKQVREIERKQLIEAMTFVFGNQAFLPIVMPKANEWLERLIDYFDLRSPEQLYVSDEEMAVAQMQQFMQMMLMQNAQGMGKPQSPALGEREMRMPEQSPNPMTMQMLGR